MAKDIGSIIEKAMKRTGIPAGKEFVDIRWYGGMFGKELTKQVEKRMDMLAANVERIAKLSMKEPKSGIKYPWLRVRSAAPGEAPAAQTGQLRASITWERWLPGVRAVGTNVIYGRFLELGTSRMLPRPYLRPALDGSAIFAKGLFRGK